MGTGDGMSPSWPEVPDFGAVLAGHIADVPAEGMPAFLAGLERSAAARYRVWAEQLPDHADVLNECAVREDEIAALVSSVFPISDESQAAVDDALPAAIQTYYEAFAPHPAHHQLYIQAEAELQGAQAWKGLSTQVEDPSVVEVLVRCAALEEASSSAVRGLLKVAPTN
jgi:hypothetical protein